MAKSPTSRDTSRFAIPTGRPGPPTPSTVRRAKHMERQHGYHLAPEDYASERSLQRAIAAPAGFDGHQLTRLDAVRRVQSPVLPMGADPTDEA